MAKTTVNVAKAFLSLKRKLVSATKNPKLLNELGETTVKNTVAQARLGKDPETLDAYAPFKNSGYSEKRKKIAAKVGAGANFKPNKSNLTLSGQLLKSIKHKIVDGEIVIEATGDHKPYYSGGKTVSNKQLAKWHSKGAGKLSPRGVIGVSPKNRVNIRKRVLDFIRRTVLRR